MVIYRFLADVTVVIHCAYASFIVLGLVAILAGMVRRWSWTRNFWFRLVHLLMMGTVVAETWCAVPCPLTVWENQLRNLAGEATYPGSFIGTLANDVLFVEVPEWLLSCAYVLFFCLIVVTLVAAPPRWPTRKGPLCGADRSGTQSGPVQKIGKMPIPLCDNRPVDFSGHGARTLSERSP